MEIKYQNSIYDLKLEPNGGNFNLKINGESKSFSARKIIDHTYSVLLNGKHVNLYAFETEDSVYVALDGKSYTFEKVKEEEKSFDGAAGASADREDIVPPMPGTVVKVLVEKDKKVKEGEALIIIEAMKMETSLYSSIEGIVTEVNVKDGEQVSNDTVMIVVEKEK